jgi:hypothetical protein
MFTEKDLGADLNLVSRRTSICRTFRIALRVSNDFRLVHFPGATAYARIDGREAHQPTVIKLNPLTTHLEDRYVIHSKFN